MTPKNNFQEWALITGASSGLGVEFAELLGEKGYNLILVARRKERLEQLAQKIQVEKNVVCLVCPCDLTDSNQRQALLQNLTHRTLIPRLVIHNAGVGVFGPFLSQSWEKLNEMLELNCASVVHFALELGRKMLQKGGGSHLFVASLAGLMPTPYYAVYGPTKSFVINLALALRHEWRNLGMNVSVLAPGSTQTEFETVAGRPTHSVRKSLLLPPRFVVEKGLEGLFKNRPLIIPGCKNRALAFCSRLVSKTWASWSAGKILKP